jgi:hypothetical protein
MSASSCDFSAAIDTHTRSTVPATALMFMLPYMLRVRPVLCDRRDCLMSKTRDARSSPEKKLCLISTIAHMDPRVWGRAFWSTIHHVAMGYPTADPTDEQVQAYRAFYTGLGSVLPCGTCSHNYARHMSVSPVDGFLDGRTSLFAWTVSLHNVVSQEQGKPQWTVERAQAHYNQGGGMLLAASAVSCAEVRRNARIMYAVIVALAMALTGLLLYMAWRARR